MTLHSLMSRQASPPSPHSPTTHSPTHSPTTDSPTSPSSPTGSIYTSDEDEGFQDTCSNTSISCVSSGSSTDSATADSSPTASLSSSGTLSPILTLPNHPPQISAKNNNDNHNDNTKHSNHVTSIRQLNTRKISNRTLLSVNSKDNNIVPKPPPVVSKTDNCDKVLTDKSVVKSELTAGSKPSNGDMRISNSQAAVVPKPVAKSVQQIQPKIHPLDLLVGLLEPELVTTVQDALKSDFEDIPEMVATCTSNKPQVATWAKKRLILDPQGSVRGRRNNVRNSVQNFMELLKDPSERNEIRNFAVEELHTCVVYVTSSGIVRESFSQSKQLMQLLDNKRIHYQRRDVYLSGTFKQELRDRSKDGIYQIPSLFVNGHLIGGYREIEKINETGLLESIFIRYCDPPEVLAERKQRQNSQKPEVIQPPIRAPAYCDYCDGRKFIVCAACHGSCKTYLAQFSCEKITLRCGKCIETPGLMRCAECL